MMSELKKLAWVCLKPYGRYLLYRMKSVSDADDLVTRIFSKFTGELQPVQSPWELREFLLRVQKMKPQRVLEIGTFHGGVFFLLTRVGSQDGTFISLDLPGGVGGDDRLDKNIPLLRRLAAAAQRLHFLREDSHRHATVKMVESILRGQKLDLLFVDGDHSYGGVKQDYEMYSPLVRPAGLIAFHDIVLDHEPQFGVARLWQELKGHYRHEEIVEDRSRSDFGGIGLLRVP